MKEGKAVEASLEHLVLYPDSWQGRLPALVLLHGRGADANDLIPIVSHVGVDGVMVLAPRAPFPFMYGGGYAWYEVTEPRIPHQETFQKSLKLLRKFLNQAKEAYPLDPSSMILLGFSQGAVMSYAAALLEPPSFKAVVALSGYIPDRSGLPFRLQDLKGFPVFISHGTFDQIIPVEYGRDSVDMLRKASAEVDFREYPMGHEVRPETLSDLRDWIKRQLPGTAKP